MIRSSVVDAVRRQAKSIVSRDALIASALMASMAFALAGPASAYRRGPVPQSVRPCIQEDAPSPTHTLLGIVSLSGQKISFYGPDGLVERSTVSTGQHGYGTPTGVFSIIQREVYHRSNLYGGAPMPYMQRITWSGVALHSGDVPGFPASHGCIRMPHTFAKRIFSMTRLGQRVLVAPHDVEPAVIAHAKLPAPVMYARDGNGAEASAAAQIAATTQAVPASAKGARTAAAGAMNPIEYARALLEEASRQSAAAAGEMKAVQAAMISKQKEQRTSARALRAAEAPVRALERELAANLRATERLTSRALSLSHTLSAGKAEGATRAEARRAARAEKELARIERSQAVLARRQAAIEAWIAKVREANEDLARRKAARNDDLAALQEKAAAADIVATATAAAAKQAARRLAPVSVFISRRTGRLYVRQAFEPVFDTAVTIEEPYRPIGTHVFVALGTTPDGSGLKWSAVTLPDHDNEWHPRDAMGRPLYSERNRLLGAAAHFRNYPARFCRPVNPAEPRIRKTIEVPAQVAARRRRARGPDTPALALDRIGIPEDAARRIAELTWVGASVLISDRDASRETRDGTDFIVLTRAKGDALR